MSVEKLSEALYDEMRKVDKRILESCKNEVSLIPDIAEHLIKAGGKRVRPLLTIASAKLAGYDGERHINLAASVEFMHTATLLHDDVVDDSNKRRGRDTANYIWGNKASVLVGDYLLGRAFQMMVSDGSLVVLKILSDAAAKIAEGEVMQLTTTNKIETSIEEYTAVIKAKTAELFAAACEVGGAVTDDITKQNALRSFGENFGIAFQIIDDALDYSANPEKFGKTIGDDFREGKVTLPVIYAYESANAEDRKFWADIIEGSTEAREAELEKAKELINKSGAFDKAIKTAKDYAARAKSSLDIFGDSSIKSMLLAVVDNSINREF